MALSYKLLLVVIMATYGNTNFKIANTWNQFYFPMASDIYVQWPFQEPISEGTYHGFTAWNVIIVDCPRYFPSNPFKSHEIIPLNIIKHHENPPFRGFSHGFPVFFSRNIQRKAPWSLGMISTRPFLWKIGGRPSLGLSRGSELSIVIEVKST